MVQIYNATEDSYMTLAAYIAAYDADDEDTYYVHFLWKLTSLFEKAKKITARRGKYARDGQGNSMLTTYAMTDDEEDFFDEALEVGSGEVYQKLLAWSKNVFNSYQYKALYDWGTDYSRSGDINGYQAAGGTSQIEDLDASWTTNALAGMIFAVTSGDFQDYHTIVSNTPTTIILDGEFAGDVEGESYLISGDDSLTESSLMYFLTMPNYPYFENFETTESKLEELLALYTVKEWYLINRLMDDHAIENARYEKLLDDVSRMLQARTSPPKRDRNFLGTHDYEPTT